jgi:hypothetical protein
MKTHRLVPVLLLALVLPAQSQLLSFGVRGGVPLTSAFSNASDGNSTAHDYNRRYTLGPTIEAHLPLRFSLEVDALYRRNGFAYTTSQSFFYPLPPTYEINVYSFFRSTINDWQVPILVKYQLASGVVRPFVDGGLVYRHVSGAASTNVVAGHMNAAGVGLGSGITFKVGRFRVEPEVRYTYWPTQPYSSGTGDFVSTKNQADLLLGVSF